MPCPFHIRINDDIVSVNPAAVAFIAPVNEVVGSTVDVSKTHQSVVVMIGRPSSDDLYALEPASVVRSLWAAALADNRGKPGYVYAVAPEAVRAKEHDAAATISPLELATGWDIKYAYYKLDASE